MVGRRLLRLFGVLQAGIGDAAYQHRNSTALSPARWRIDWLYGLPVSAPTHADTKARGLLDIP